MIVGERIKALMLQQGLSQAELARRVGVKQPSIFRLIHENKRGSKVLHKVARELRTTPAYLSGETDDPESDLPDDALTSDEREWLELLRSLEPKDREAVVTLTRSLANSARGPTIHDRAGDYRGKEEGPQLR